MCLCLTSLKYSGSVSVDKLNILFAESFTLSIELKKMLSGNFLNQEHMCNIYIYTSFGNDTDKLFPKPHKTKHKQNE